MTGNDVNARKEGNMQWTITLYNNSLKMDVSCINTIECKKKNMQERTKDEARSWSVFHKMPAVSLLMCQCVCTNTTQAVFATFVLWTIKLDVLKNSLHVSSDSLCLCSVTSSEKADKAQRYADFTLLSVPYPGKQIM